jgi:hypothetical protein
VEGQTGFRLLLQARDETFTPVASRRAPSTTQPLLNGTGLHFLRPSALHSLSRNAIVSTNGLFGDERSKDASPIDFVKLHLHWFSRPPFPGTPMKPRGNIWTADHSDQGSNISSGRARKVPSATSHGPEGRGWAAFDRHFARSTKPSRATPALAPITMSATCNHNHKPLSPRPEFV